MASAILTIVLPDRFGVIDVRAWATLYRWKLVTNVKTSFVPDDYGLYLKIIRRLSNRANLTPRKVDMALFAYDDEHRNGPLRLSGR